MNVKYADMNMIFLERKIFMILPRVLNVERNKRLLRIQDSFISNQKKWMQMMQYDVSYDV